MAPANDIRVNAAADMPVDEVPDNSGTAGVRAVSAAALPPQAHVAKAAERDRLAREHESKLEKKQSLAWQNEEVDEETQKAIQESLKMQAGSSSSPSSSACSIQTLLSASVAASSSAPTTGSLSSRQADRFFRLRVKAGSRYPTWENKASMTEEQRAFIFPYGVLQYEHTWKAEADPHKMQKSKDKEVKELAMMALKDQNCLTEAERAAKEARDATRLVRQAKDKQINGHNTDMKKLFQNLAACRKHEEEARREYKEAEFNEAMVAAGLAYDERQRELHEKRKEETRAARKRKAEEKKEALLAEDVARKKAARKTKQQEYEKNRVRSKAEERAKKQAWRQKVGAAAVNQKQNDYRQAVAMREAGKRQEEFDTREILRLCEKFRKEDEKKKAKEEKKVAKAVAKAAASKAKEEADELAILSSAAPEGTSQEDLIREVEELFH
jgi:hypothetical protein